MSTKEDLNLLPKHLVPVKTPKEDTASSAVATSERSSFGERALAKTPLAQGRADLEGLGAKATALEQANS